MKRALERLWQDFRRSYPIRWLVYDLSTAWIWLLMPVGVLVFIGLAAAPFGFGLLAATLVRGPLHVYVQIFSRLAGVRETKPYHRLFDGTLIGVIIIMMFLANEGHFPVRPNDTFGVLMGMFYGYGAWSLYMPHVMQPYAPPSQPLRSHYLP